MFNFLFIFITSDSTNDSNTIFCLGAEIVGKGMVKGAVKTSEMLFLGTDYAKQYVTPDQAKNIDPRLKSCLIDCISVYSVFLVV